MPHFVSHLRFTHNAILPSLLRNCSPLLILLRIKYVLWLFSNVAIHISWRVPISSALAVNVLYLHSWRRLLTEVAGGDTHRSSRVLFTLQSTLQHHSGCLISNGAVWILACLTLCLKISFLPCLSPLWKPHDDTHKWILRQVECFSIYGMVFKAHFRLFFYQRILGSRKQII